MGDSYRPGRPDRDRRPLADRMTFGESDTYRPGRNGSEFTFQSNYPAPQFPPTGPSNPGSRASRRNRGGASQRAPRRADHHEPSRNGRGNANNSRRGAYRKQAPHERALLRHREGGSPEQTLGVIEGSNRFLNIDELSDDAEADMDVEGESSDSDGAVEGESRNRKVARTVAVDRADGDSVPQWAEPQPEPAKQVPKWSNPDPYTALPPPSETTGVKKDVVQFIRKAKNQASEKAASNNAVAANDDFISFGDDDEDDEEEVDDAPGLHIYTDDEPIPRGPRKERGRKRSMDYGTVEGSLNDLRNGPPTESHRDSNRSQPFGRGNKRKFGSDVVIVPEWIPQPYCNPTPWFANPRAYAHLAGEPERWLHNEILDFYDFVAPQPFEHEARHKLVHRISDALSVRRWFPHDTGRILSFGSFPAGLYLPTADMDLVYASDRHYNGGPPVLESTHKNNPFKNILYKAARRLEDVHIAATRPTVIAMARVPIIKFRDRITGIDVDISFENLSGVQAQATFDRWKTDYPDMVYMVALVKQFLVMRGLNEVHTGGIGGFTIICLVVSYIHHSPKFANLGEGFVGFLKYYGKIFDLSRQRIQMNPPAIVEKGDWGIDDRPEKLDGLSIQDPNKPDNNISGGSRKAGDVFRAFAAAYDTLSDRMDAAKSGQNIGTSLLGHVLGGNYNSYIMQRRHLKTLE